MVFKKTQFNIDINKVKFFQEVFDTNKSEYNLNFKDSILFYKNKNDDVIFFTSIDDLNFSYNKEFQSQLDSSYEIFNIPFNLKIINDSDNKKIITKLDSHKIRLNINNDFNYHEEDPNGLLEFEIINKSKFFKYIISNNSLNFNSNDNSFKGNLDFRPFYFKSDLNFNQLDIKNIFKSNSILLDLLYSKILNNQNLNAHININFDKIKGVNYLKNVNLKTYFEEGRIIIKNSNLDWNNSLLINLDEIQLIEEKNELLFVGGITFEFIDIENFYSHYQIKKNYRKKINKIRLDFLFNLDENLIQIDNLKIDGTSTKSVDNYLNEFNSKKINIFNKVILRNSMKEFFAVYHEG